MDIVRESLLNNKLALEIAHSDIKLIDMCTNIAYEEGMSYAQHFTVCRQLLYLVVTFCSKPYTYSEIANNEIIKRYIALSIEDKVEQGSQLAYENDKLKEYLKCSNTILNIADTIYTGGKVDKDFYTIIKNKSIIAMSTIWTDILDGDSVILDKTFWLKTVEWIDKRVQQEIRYCDGEQDIPSDRMINNIGISKSVYDGFRTIMYYNQSYKTNELV